MKKTSRETLVGFFEALIGFPNSQIGCGFFIAIFGLVLLLAPMAEGEKPISFTLISIVLIIISLIVIINRIRTLRNEDKNKRL